MAEFLTIQVRLGRITIDQVPERWCPEVETLLAACGGNCD